MGKVLLFGCTIPSIVLAILAKQNPYFPLDLKITLFIQKINFFWFDLIMKLISWLGNPLQGSIIAVSIYAFFLINKWYKALLYLFISTTGGLVLGNLFKSYAARIRPDPDLIQQINIYLAPDSFPSGHVLFFISFFGFLIFLLIQKVKKRPSLFPVILFLIFLVSLVGLSRIYLGAHWFSDVVGAYLIGIAWLSLVIIFYKRI